MKNIIILCLLLSLSCADVLNFGSRNGLMLGLEFQNLSKTEWLGGYGAGITNTNRFFAYYSFSQMNNNPPFSLPLVISFGPELSIKNGRFGAGAYVKLTWLGLISFNPELDLSVGAEMLTDESSLILSIGYRFPLVFRIPIIDDLFKTKS